MNFSKLLFFIFLFVFACMSVTNGSLSGIRETNDSLNTNSSLSGVRGKRQWGYGYGNGWGKYLKIFWYYMV